MKQNPGVAMALALALSAALVIPAKALYGEQGIKKPSLTLKATPAVSFAPARIVVVAEVKGGPNDFEEFYCPSIEWDWGDFTSSTAEADCEPYETGKSEIKRRYTIEHRYKNPGGYKIVLRLKKGNKIIATANAMVQVRAGLGQ
jgi:hypothetical protein